MLEDLDSNDFDPEDYIEDIDEIIDKKIKMLFELKL